MKVLFFVLIPLVFSFSFINLTSSVLDFVPFIGNAKSLYEAYSGKDIIIGENLSVSDRSLSFIGAIPFGNYLKTGKYLKNGKKFIKAA